MGFPQNGRGKRTDAIALTGTPPADIAAGEGGLSFGIQSRKFFEEMIRGRGTVFSE